MKLSKEKRDQLLLVGLITSGVLAGLWYGLVKNRMDRLETTQMRVAQAHQKYEQAQSWIGRADTVKAEMASVVEQLGTIESEMASPADPYSWGFLLLEKAKANHRIEIENLTRPEIRAVTLLPDFPYQAAIFTVNGFAFYHDLGRFVSEFENRFPFYRIQRLSLASGLDSTLKTGGKERHPEEIVFRMDIVALVKPAKTTP